MVGSLNNYGDFEDTNIWENLYRKMSKEKIGQINSKAIDHAKELFTRNIPHGNNPQDTFLLIQKRRKELIIDLEIFLLALTKYSTLDYVTDEDKIQINKMIECTKNSFVSLGGVFGVKEKKGKTIDELEKFRDTGPHLDTLLEHLHNYKNHPKEITQDLGKISRETADRIIVNLN